MNQTYFTTQENATARTRVIKGPVEDRDCFILMSDGAAERLIDETTSAPTPGALKTGRWLLRYPRDVVEHRLQAAIKEHFIPHGDDDCGIALLAFAARQGPSARVRVQRRVKALLRRQAAVSVEPERTA